MFRNRRDAGERLARVVEGQNKPHPLVLALPRGGVPVAERVAESLGVPMDIVVVRKIPVPGSPETAIGATTAEGPPLFDRRALDLLGLSEERLADMAGAEQTEARRRVQAYRGDAPDPEVAERDVFVIDDGLATGMSARAALAALREQGPASLVLAVPVGAPDAVHALADVCDQVVCLETPSDFGAVSLWYEDFPQVSDEEVLALLNRAGTDEGRAP
ncbi:phosphoribosyltransferase [Nocardiopsis quinghaiensis]|uniref:phosphoribosyltransferase n=1 Tax=Nocardiopsis quinghaiensis TaxID=464995 RepID=UPI00123C1362|nr:phosphoribosyltransferase family protein [Nocardiopsis quinghaiensis]